MFMTGLIMPVLVIIMVKVAAMQDSLQLMPVHVQVIVVVTTLPISLFL